MFESDIDDVTGTLVMTEYKCRRLTLLNMIVAVATKELVAPVSIVHQCDCQCTFASSPSNKKCEREVIELQQLTLVHNIETENIF